MARRLGLVATTLALVGAQAGAVEPSGVAGQPPAAAAAASSAGAAGVASGPTRQAANEVSLEAAANALTPPPADASAAGTVGEAPPAAAAAAGDPGATGVAVR
jgi:hypothetical protein